MARGWESKSVEAQIEEASSAKPFEGKSALTEEQAQNKIRKADLVLSRRRVLQQLEHSTNERYCELLRRTLADLDTRIAAL
jgi:precorrin-6B methylase 1